MKQGSDPEDRLRSILQTLTHNPQGHSWEERTALCEEALQLLPEAVAPSHWATLQSELGLALYRSGGETAENIERALRALRQALRILTPAEELAVWATAMSRLALIVRNRQRGDPDANIRLAIETYEELLTNLTADSLPETWASAQVNLGYLYYERFETSSSTEDWAASIGAFEKGLMVPTQLEPIDRAHGAMNLATLYLHRPTGTQEDDIERALQFYSEALEIFTPEARPVDWARAASYLGGAYLQRQTGSRTDNVEAALALCQAAIAILDPQHHSDDWIGVQLHLGHAWRHRALGDRSENQEHALTAYQAALAARDREGHPVEWAMAAMTLGNLYQERLNGDRGENLKMALQLYRQALGKIERTSHPREWAELQENLGNAHLELPYGDLRENLFHSIACYEHALEVYARDSQPFAWAMTMNNLGNSYRRLGTPESIETACECYEQALEVRTRQAAPRDWALTLTNLGIAYRDRPVGDRPANLEKAIELFETALEVQAPEEAPADWAATMIHLGSTLPERLLEAPEKNVERSIATLWQAIEVCDQHGEHYLRATGYMYIGVAFLQRPRGEADENIDLALEAFEQALQFFARETYPIDWGNTWINVASACEARERGDRADNIAQGLEACELALQVFSPQEQPLEWSVAMSLRALLRTHREDLDGALNDFHRVLEVLAPERFSAQCRQTAQRLGDLLFERNDWTEAVRIYAIATRAAEQLYHQSLQTQGKQAELADLLDLHRRNAYALARCGRTREAVLALEQSRARGLGLPLGKWEDLSRAAEPAYPLMYLVTVSAGSLALLVRAADSSETEASVEILLIDSLAEPQLQDWLMRWHRDELVGGYVHALLQERTELRTSLEEILPKIGELLMKAVAAAMLDSTVRGVVLLPTGLLTLLPLHAAPLSDDRSTTLLDVVEIRYAVSARSLASSRGLLLHRPVTEPHLVGVGNPLPNPLPLVYGAAEVHEVAAVFGPDHSDTLYGSEARSSRLLPLLTDATHIHLSCHGLFDAWEPLRSHLQLSGDDRLSLGQIQAMNALLPNARLVSLSACETAVTEFQNIPDEFVGLPIGFLQAGVPGVLGTLWSVRELSTALLIRAFYIFHLRGDPDSAEPPMSPAAALRRAQLWLRDVPARALGEFFEGTGKLVGRRVRQDPEHWPPELLDRTTTLFLLEDPESRPYHHPYFWAGFVLVGA